MNSLTITPEALRRPVRIVSALALLLAVAALGGCAKPPAAPPKSSLPDVIVAVPVIRSVTDSEDFTGRTEAYRYVEIRPQVTGELDQVHFTDGDYVMKGAPLFDIDRRIYAAQRNSAKAALEQAKAKLDLAKASLVRAEKSYREGATPKEEYDTKVADRDSGKAGVDAAQAALDLAEQNLAWTHITARYSGRLSKRMIDPGNIVKANETPLTTLIVLDPIYIGFDIDERTLERRREGIAAGKIPSARDETLVVQVGLGHQEGYPFTATVTFADNQLDAGTGTLHVRALMENPGLRLSSLPAVTGWAAYTHAEQQTLRLLSPGMFVRVKLPMGKPHDALMIPEEAIGSDQGQKFVFVLNEKNEVVYRRVTLGPQLGNLRAVEERNERTAPGEGIARGERVIARGQQRVRAGGKVNPKMLDQPNGPSTAATQLAKSGGKP